MKRATRPDLTAEVITAIEELKRAGNEDPGAGEIAEHLQVHHPESNVKCNIGYIWCVLSDFDALRRKKR